MKTQYTIWLYLVIISALLTACGIRSDAEDSAALITLEEHEKKEVVIFVYHRFGNPKYPSTNISVSDFESQLSYLQAAGFTIMSFGEAVEYVSDHRQPFVEKVACLTVDDGYKTFYTNAMPLLIKFGFKATVFINSKSVGFNDFMSWDELKIIIDNGIEIGNHSHSHEYFLDVQEQDRVDAFKNDLIKCQELINKQLGFFPNIFAYPYGEYDLEMKNVLSELGFKAAAAQNSGVLYDFDPFAIPRFPMAGPFTKIEAFKEKANMKALRISSKNPESPVMLNLNNPPSLSIAFDSPKADLSRHNCFISEGCESSLQGNEITLRASKSLRSRRTLYKITAPAKNGKDWYWFSHLWIQPDIKE